MLPGKAITKMEVMAHPSAMPIKSGCVEASPEYCRYIIGIFGGREGPWVCAGSFVKTGRDSCTSLWGLKGGSTVNNKGIHTFSEWTKKYTKFLQPFDFATRPSLIWIALQG